jgi:hypothetical protein
VDYAIAVVALLVAVWAVMGSRAARDRAEHAWDVSHAARQCGAAREQAREQWFDSRLSALEERVERVEQGFMAATAPLSVEPSA